MYGAAFVYGAVYAISEYMHIRDRRQRLGRFSVRFYDYKLAREVDGLGGADFSTTFVSWNLSTVSNAVEKVVCEIIVKNIVS